MSDEIKYWQRVKANAHDTILIAEERIKELSSSGSGKPKNSKRAVPEELLLAISLKSRQRRLAPARKG